MKLCKLFRKKKPSPSRPAQEFSADQTAQVPQEEEVLAARNIIMTTPLVPVAFDAVGAGTPYGSKGSTPQTWSHTVSTRSDVVVILALSITANAGGSTSYASMAPTAVTFGGQAMNLLATQPGNNDWSNNQASALYYLFNPTNRGTQTVSVTGLAASQPFFWANTTSYTGVRSLGTPVTDYGYALQSPSVGPVASSINHMVVSILSRNAGAGPPTSHTVRWGESATSHNGYIQDAPGAATVTMTSSNFGSLQGEFSAIAVDLRPY
jgi:hypothetical protein